MRKTILKRTQAAFSLSSKTGGKVKVSRKLSEVEQIRRMLKKSGFRRLSDEELDKSGMLKFLSAKVSD